MIFNEVFSESLTIKKDGISLTFYANKVKEKDNKILCVDNHKNVWRFRHPDRASKDHRLVPYNPNTKVKHHALIDNKTIKEIVLTKEQIKFFKGNIQK